MNGTEVVHDLSLWGLFWAAHPVVKAVMLGLVLASVWTWMIIVNKALLFRRVRREMDRFEEAFWSGQSLEDLYQRLAPTEPAGMSGLFVAAMREWKRAFEAGGRGLASLGSRVDRVLDVAITREGERHERQLLILATVGSASPFIGLFGTVWGIMTSFTSIAASKNTSLAVVAPGIAEALFATAIGLAAAIPAVIAYNAFVREAAKARARLEGFADEFATLLTRQIDERVAV